MIAELRTACAAFLVAVLVADLTFDLPVLRARDTATVARAVDAASRYYARITATGSPLAAAVTLALLTLLAALGAELWKPSRGAARAAVEAILAGGPIALAVTRTFPTARWLGRAESDPATSAVRARAIAREHLLALAGMGSYLAIQVVGAGP
jgi:hypothetical protein